MDDPLLHPIFHAARDDRLDDVRRYVWHDAGLVCALDKTGETPLMKAAFNGNPNVVRYLLDHGAEMDRRSTHGSTALRLACVELGPEFDEGQLAVVELLLQRGADVTIGWDGSTVLLQAAADGRANMVGLLLAHGGSDVDMMSWQGTALLYACGNGFVVIVMQLLEAGADPAVQRAGTDKQSPFEAAVENEHDDVISILHEWDRAYMLTRARRVHDDVQKVLGVMEGGRIDAAPAYLPGRVTAMGSRDGDAVELPQVEVRADHGVRGVAKRRGRDREREDDSGMEGSGGLAARHVLQVLSGELFVELMGMCELFTDQAASADAEDEVEEGSDDDDDDDDGNGDEYESASDDSDDS